MSCSNCEKLKKEMEDFKDTLQLKEFELEEKLNTFEDRLEWANEDISKLKAELEDTKEERDRYKVLAQSLGIDREDVTQHGSQTPKDGKNISRLLEIIKKQAELLEEMKSLLVIDSLSR
ncbi:uncharacterized protein LOC100899990 [Galendromus occidentalis]|uniref:Uncharacterized protein LOC100899990 n=1 Tax=Galendromus occidentalis TaxID=34638 RepID=A0AAJ6QW66_9ACAR|nr:uncharacterized protein LOC100899990 [Galendromus occidentalis]